jgi:methionyl-tRNA formyltransferase
MRIVGLISASDPFGGIFARAYRDCGGPSFCALLVLPDRKEVGGRLFDRLAAAATLLRPKGVARLLAARMGIPRAADRAVGMNLRWPNALAGPETRVLRLENLKDESQLLKLKELEPEMIVSIGAPVILRPSVLALASIGAINVHNALLPKYRGHFGTFWEVYHGEPRGYVCIHEMAAKVDLGRMLAWEAVDLKSLPSFLDLLIEKKRVGGTLLGRLLQGIQRDGALPATERIDSAGSIPDSYFPFPSPQEVLRLKWGRCT